MLETISGKTILCASKGDGSTPVNPMVKIRVKKTPLPFDTHFVKVATLMKIFLTQPYVSIQSR